VYLPNGDKFVVRSGNLAYIANKGNRRSSIICQDVDAEITELERTLGSAQWNLQLLRREEANAQDDVADFRGLVNQAKERVDKLSWLYNRQRAELHSLEEGLMDSQQDETLDTSVLDAEMHGTQDELEQLQAREQELDKRISASRLDLEGPLRELEELDTMEQQIGAELNAARREAEASCQQLSQLKMHESMNQHEHKAALLSAEHLQQQWRALQAEATEQADKALELCSRPAEPHSPAHYAKKIKVNKRQRARAQKCVQGHSLGELEDVLKQRRALYDKKKTNFEGVRANLNRVRGMLEERVKTWKRFRKLISQRTSKEFDRYMKLNNFVGKLKFLHEQQRLEITLVQNEQGATRASQVTDMKELSGGERSYTQVALLLALGQNVECPFRIMDEFDVFMDAVNRDSTVELLVEAAKKSAKKQFIFVTPNDLTWGETCIACVCCCCSNVLCLVVVVARCNRIRWSRSRRWPLLAIVTLRLPSEQARRKT
jgi:chromosome segregation ATPase